MSTHKVDSPIVRHRWMKVRVVPFLVLSLRRVCKTFSKSPVETNTRNRRYGGGRDTVEVPPLGYSVY